MQLPTSAFVSTSDDPDDNLDLEDAGTYRIVSVDPGAPVWLRNRASSVYVHGGTLVHAKKDVTTTLLSIRCYGDDADDLHDNIATLISAFSQFRYRLGMTIDEVDYEWICEPADIAPNGGGGWDKFGLVNHQQVYDFSVPRDPIPVQGAH